jgi:hypothetical protein
MKELIQNNSDAMDRIRLAERFPVKKSKLILTKEEPWTETGIEKEKTETEFNGNVKDSDEEIKEKGMAAFSL